MKQITIKEIKELAHMVDNNHIATVIANYYFRESNSMEQDGYTSCSEYYYKIWCALVDKLDELEKEDN